VAFEQVGAGFAITQIQLTLKAKVPGATEEKLKELAGLVKANCLVSKLLKAEIGLEVTLAK